MLRGGFMKIVSLCVIMFTQVCATERVDHVLHGVPRLSKQVAGAIHAWFDAHSELTKSLVAYDCEAKSFDENNAQLLHYGIKNLSRNNYVFVCPTAPDYIIKISGPLGRMSNTVVEHGLWPSVVTKCNRHAMRQGTLPQRMSAFPAYLSYLKLTKFQTLHHVYIPKTYLFHIFNNTEFIVDAPCVIVQERLDLFDWQESHEMAKSLNAEQLKELAVTVHACGLWDIKDRIYFLRDGRITLIDLEQYRIGSSHILDE
jgi:hypothetical protein